jgi:quercetin dioxygenase-like cupin family protein
MFVPLFAATARKYRQRSIGLAAVAAVASLAVSSLTTVPALADPWWRDPPATTIAAQPASPSLAAFDATGIPGGAAKGVPQRVSLPPGFNLKHVHGGPSYVYVISGNVDIVDADGTRASYQAGDFFWEPVGHVHTAQSAGGAELFILRFLAPGAVGTIPLPE